MLRRFLNLNFRIPFPFLNSLCVRHIFVYPSFVKFEVKKVKNNCDLHQDTCIFPSSCRWPRTLWPSNEVLFDSNFLFKVPISKQIHKTSYPKHGFSKQNNTLFIINYSMFSCFIFSHELYWRGCVNNEIYLEQTVLFIVWLVIFQNSTTEKTNEVPFTDKIAIAMNLGEVIKLFLCWHSKSSSANNVASLQTKLNFQSAIGS